MTAVATHQSTPAFALSAFAPEHVGQLRGWFPDKALSRYIPGGCPQLERLLLSRNDRMGFALTDPDGHLLGVCALEFEQPDVATVTYAVAPAARGLGVGRAMLAAVVAHTSLAHVDFEAHVERSNRASAACLLASGFREIGTPIEDGQLYAFVFERLR